MEVDFNSLSLDASPDAIVATDPGGKAICRAALETANEELEAFSYSISHDWRAPVRAMNGFAGMLKRKFGAQPPHEAHAGLDRIRVKAVQMGQLIDGPLSFSRLGRPALMKGNVDPAEPARNAFETLQVELTIADLPRCQVDSTLLDQVFVNLRSSALKYLRDR